MQDPHKKILLIALLAHLVAAWCSLGYHHPDEHFQILEFCGYLLGRTPAEALPWEFAAQIRPSLQPVLAYGLHWVFSFFGGENPFVFVFLIRLLLGFGLLHILWRLIQLLLSDFKNEKTQTIFVYVSLLLWFVPYFNVRFSSENMAAFFFLLGSYWILKTKVFENSKQFFVALLIGLCFGLSFEFRYQMGFALIGVGSYLLFIKKINLMATLWMLVGFGLAFGLGTLSDWWFYGAQICAPYNYFASNILEGKAASFGESPWWAYFQFFLTDAVPPLSFVLLILLGWGMYVKKRHLFTFAFVPFFLAHCLVSHKELRFLAPMLFPVCYFVAIGFQAFLARFTVNKAWIWFRNVLLSMNIVLLVFVVFTPAHEAFPYLRFLYDYGETKGETTLYCTESSPYRYIDLTVHFFKKENIEVQVFENMEILRATLEKEKPKNALILSKRIRMDVDFDGYTKERVYCFFPDWIGLFNINGWQERSYIWSVYELER